MKKYFSIGDQIHGFCNGYFGSSDYDSKICVYVSDSYAVFQYTEGSLKGCAIALNHPTELSKCMVNEWKTYRE